MTREEALEALELSSDASADTARERYESLYSDLRVRLTNAPTPHLRGLYQQRLRALDEAAGVLNLSTGAQADLPASAPVEVIPGTTAKSGRASGKRRKADEDASASAAQRGLGRERHRDRDRDRRRDRGGDSASRGLTWLAPAIAIVAVATLGFGWLQLQGARQATAEAGASAEQIRNTVAGFEALLENHRFVVRNANDTPIEVTWLSSVFVETDSDGERTFTVYDSAFNDYPSWTIAPGGEMSFEDGDNWGGAVLFYAMDIKFKGSQYPASGIWPDNDDGVLTIRF